MELVVTIDLESKALRELREAELSRIFYQITNLIGRGETKGIIFDKDQCDQGDWEITESLADMEPRK